MEYLVKNWFESPVEKLTYLVRDGNVVSQKFSKKDGMPHLCRKRVAHVKMNRRRFIKKVKEEREQAALSSSTHRSQTSLRNSGPPTRSEEEEDENAQEEIVVMACMWSRMTSECFFVLTDSDVVWVEGELKRELPFGAQTTAYRSLQGLVRQIQKASVSSQGGAKTIAVDKYVARLGDGRQRER